MHQDPVARCAVPEDFGQPKSVSNNPESDIPVGLCCGLGGGFCWGNDANPTVQRNLLGLDFPRVLSNPEFINRIESSRTKINTGTALSQTKHIWKDKLPKASLQDELRGLESLRLESLPNPPGT